MDLSETDVITGGGEGESLPAEERKEVVEGLAEEHGEEAVTKTIFRFGGRKIGTGVHPGTTSALQAVGKEALDAENDVRDQEQENNPHIDSIDDLDISEEEVEVYRDLVELTDEYKDEHSNDEGEYEVHRGMKHRTPALASKILDDPDKEEYDLPDKEVSIAYTPEEHVGEDFTGQYSSGILHTVDATEEESVAMDTLLTQYQPDDPEFPEEMDRPPQPASRHDLEDDMEDEEDHGILFKQEEAEHLITDQQSVKSEELSIPRTDKNASEVIKTVTEEPEEAEEDEHFAMAQIIKKIDRDNDVEGPETEEGIKRLKNWGEFREEQDTEQVDDYHSKKEDVERVDRIIDESDHDVSTINEVEEHGNNNNPEENTNVNDEDDNDDSSFWDDELKDHDGATKNDED